MGYRNILIDVTFRASVKNVCFEAFKTLMCLFVKVETPEESSNLHDIYTGWMK